MQGQQRGPNYQRNCEHQKAKAAEVKAAKEATYYEGGASAHAVAQIGHYDICKVYKFLLKRCSL